MDQSRLEPYDVDSDENNLLQKRQSSILKSRKSLALEMDDTTTDTAPVRRVSFAARNFVKPFVTDAEKNTIWDITYEEEANHTDSTKSDQTNPTMSTRFLNSEMGTIYAQESMEMSSDNCMLQQKTISSGKIQGQLEITQRRNRVREPKKFLQTDGNLTQQDLQSDMSFTGRFPENMIQNTQLVRENQQINLCRENMVEVSKKIIPTSNTTQQDLQTDTSFTCRFPENSIQQIQLVRQNSLYRESLVEGSISDVAQQNLESDMSFTCRIPEIVIQETEAFKRQQQQRDMRQIAFNSNATQLDLQRDVSFTCRFSKDMIQQSQLVQYQQSQANQSFVQQNIQSDMSFTCRFSENIQQGTATSHPINPMDMSLTCRLPGNTLSDNKEKKKISLLSYAKSGINASQCVEKENVKERMTSEDLSILTCPLSGNALSDNKEKKKISLLSYAKSGINASQCVEKENVKERMTSENVGISIVDSFPQKPGEIIGDEKYSFQNIKSTNPIKHSTKKNSALENSKIWEKNLSLHLNKGTSTSKDSENIEPLKFESGCDEFSIEINKIARGDSKFNKKNAAMPHLNDKENLDSVTGHFSKKCSGLGVEKYQQSLENVKMLPVNDRLIHPEIESSNTLQTQTSSIHPKDLKVNLLKLNIVNPPIPQIMPEGEVSKNSAAFHDSSFLRNVKKLPKSTLVNEKQLYHEITPDRVTHPQNDNNNSFVENKLFIKSATQESALINEECDLVNLSDYDLSLRSCHDKSREINPTPSEVTRLNVFQPDSSYDLESTKQFLNIKPNMSTSHIEHENNLKLILELSRNYHDIPLVNKIKENCGRINLPSIDWPKLKQPMSDFQELHDKAMIVLKNYNVPELNSIDMRKAREEMLRKSPNMDRKRSMETTLFVRRDSQGVDLLSTVEESVVKLCSKKLSKHIQLFKHAEEQFVFKILEGSLFVHVKLYSDSDQVLDIKFLSALDLESLLITHFTERCVKEKLSSKNLSSFLGEGFDVLTLLDYMYMTVEEALTFQNDFISLSVCEEFFTLEIGEDLSIRYALLNIKPASGWKVRIDMPIINKIQHENITIESVTDRIHTPNEKCIKNLLKDVEDGKSCIRSFLANLNQYFKSQIS